MAQQAQAVRKETLPNGLSVITEEMPHLRTVAVGAWLKRGSRVEPTALNGICHFIEHMVFKGTERRSAEEIAREVDSLGGHLDAFTAKETVCFNTKVLDEHLPHAFDVLADLVQAPLFRDTDIGRERSVILEEIKMEEDNPDYLVHEIFSQNFWYDHPMGRPILGTQETLERLHHQVVDDFFRRWYVPNQMLITAAGRLDHARFVDLVAEKFQHLRPYSDGHQDCPPQAHARVTLRHKADLEQVHLCLGVPCYPLPHERRYAVSLLNNILGGGMSSRLFQNIREREGLAYAIFSDAQSYHDTGCLTVYAGTSRETARQTLRLILQEFSRLKREPVSLEDLRRAQDNLKAGLMFTLESSAARMSKLAREYIYFGRPFSVDEILAAVDAVTPDQIQAVAREFFQPELIGASLLGELEGFRLGRDEFEC